MGAAPEGIGAVAKHHPLAPAARDLRLRAESVDVDLVRAALAPRRAQRQLLWDLNHRVTEVEHLVMRISTNADRLARLTPALPGIDSVEERLDAFEAALRELEPSPLPGQLEVERLSRPRH